MPAIIGSILGSIARLIGWGGVLCVILYVYEEGIPGASRIPFLSSVPVFGDLATGRVHAYAADQVRIATASAKAQCDARMEKMVSGFQYDALAAQLAEERRRRAIADNLAATAEKRADEALKAKTKAEADLESRIAADTDPDGGRWTEEDGRWNGKR